MASFPFDRRFLVGLYLLLRQLQLSIDRSYGSTWESLVNYFAERTPIQNVLNRLKNANVVDMDQYSDEAVEQPKFDTRLFSRLMKQKGCLSEKELLFVYRKLKVVYLLFGDKDPPDHEHLVRLRLDLAHAEDLIRNRLDKKLIKNKCCVEHFNQNEILDCKSLDELVGNGWL